MSANREATVAKDTLWDRIQNECGRFAGHDRRRPHWRISENGLCSVSLAYSRYHEQPNWYWYGLYPQDVAMWAKYTRAFVVFVLGGADKFVTLPTGVVTSIMATTSNDQAGQHKFNIVPTPHLHFLTAPDFELVPYVNSLGLVRSACLPRQP
jgi:hypothetical protein